MTKKKRPKNHSQEWFAVALSHPAFEGQSGQIREICALADKFHHTVSAQSAHKAKSAFLSDLRKLLMHSSGGEAALELRQLIVRTRSLLRRLNDEPAINPRGWKIPVKVAQVSPQHRLLKGSRGLQGGAPQ